jgi:hypothetical protein
MQQLLAYSGYCIPVQFLAYFFFRFNLKIIPLFKARRRTDVLRHTRRRTDVLRHTRREPLV